MYDRYLAVIHYCFIDSEQTDTVTHKKSIVEKQPKKIARIYLVKRLSSNTNDGKTHKIKIMCAILGQLRGINVHGSLPGCRAAAFWCVCVAGVSSKKALRGRSHRCISLFERTDIYINIILVLILILI